MGTVNQRSEVAICNLALLRIGSTQRITSFADGSNEAAACATLYPMLRDAVLSDFPWLWAEAYVPLAEVAGPETTMERANAVWFRSYRYPADCLKMRRIVGTPFPILVSPPQTTGTQSLNYACNEAWRRAVGDAMPISYSLSSDTTGRLIVTDQFGPNGITAVYTQAVSDPTQFDDDFSDMLAWRVAIDLAAGFAISDRKRQDAVQMYERCVRKARSTEINSGQSDIPSVTWQSETVRARWNWR